jgi:hypothetical protein
MSNVKDKLSANIRAVKDKQETAEETKQPKAAASKPAAKPAAPRKTRKKATARGKTTVPGDVPESGTQLFPSRVWPD